MIPEPPRHLLTWPEHGLDMGFRLIPPGTFSMGSRGYRASEEPVHRVRIAEAFWLAETPVTQAQFALWIRAEGIKHENHFTDHPDHLAHPAENMDWWQAVAYCAWLTRAKAAELPEGFSLVCLPTEAEWEYACRAGADTEYHSGDGEAALAEVGWYGATSCSSTHPVRRKDPNDFRLFDMHGNVWEWCHDAWNESAYRRRVDDTADPGRTLRLAEKQGGLARMTESNRIRVLRGGAWYGSPFFCRSASRSRFEPSVRSGLCGFRVGLVRGLATWRGAQQSEGAGGADVELPDLATAKLPRAARNTFD